MYKRYSTIEYVNAQKKKKVTLTILGSQSTHMTRFGKHVGGKQDMRFFCLSSSNMAVMTSSANQEWPISNIFMYLYEIYQHETDFLVCTWLIAF